MKHKTHIEIEVDVDYNYQPFEPAEWTYPGCPEMVTVESVMLGNIDIMDQLSNPEICKLAETYLQEQSEDRAA